jgi:ribosomal protein S18 acetylase RimI-like enzyme
MTSDVTIRSANGADLDALVRLLGVLFSIEADFTPDPTRQRRGLALMLQDSDQRIAIVAERAGEVVGMVTAQIVVSTAEGGPAALVEDLVVDAAERGRGIGRRLLREVEARAKVRGATRLQLLADRANASALRFYERAGWCSTALVCLRRASSG